MQNRKLFRQNTNTTMRKVILVILVILSYKVHGQLNHSKNWITGGGISYKMEFDNQQVNIRYLDTTFKFYFLGGSSCISDTTGKLRIICDGYNIMDSVGNYIENGDTIVPKVIYEKYNGFSLTPQTSIILPFQDDIYYVITPTASDYEVLTYWNDPNSGRALFDLLLYNKVDMSLNGGMGKVVKKAIPLLENVQLSKVQMMACRHSNGKDWWLLKQAHDTNMVYRFLVTKDSIYNDGVQGFAEPHFTKWDLAGQSMFSQQGDKYATLCSGRNLMFLADFDRCTGELSNGKVINLANHVYHPADTALDWSPGGLCFSPNGKFLYVVKGYNIFQYEIDEPDSNLAWYHIANMDTTYAQFQVWGNAYLGNDGKLYISNWNGLGKATSYLSDPDAKGAACGFCAKCLQFPKIGTTSVPCMPNYALGKDTINPCWPLESSEIKVVSSEMQVYPNPSSSVFYIKNRIGKKKTLYNVTGELLFSTKADEIDVSRLAKGVYYIKCLSEGQTGEDGVKKVIVE